MAPLLAELTAQARTLTSAGDLVAARAVLADALGAGPADPRNASPETADAAALLARVLVALGEPHAARVWVSYAHAAQEHLYGPHDARTLAVATLHAAVLHRTGTYGQAVRLYHDLAGELTAAEGAGSARALAAEADLATAEHAAGQCTAARGRLAQTWQRHRQAYGDAAPASIKMLARLGVLERECGQGARAVAHLAQAQELCARYLPADHPLAVGVADLARTPASGRHVCGRPEGTAGAVATVDPRPPVRPARPPRGGWQPTALVTAMGTGIVVAVVITIAVLWRADGGPTPAAAPPSALAPPPAETAPSDLRLRDNRDSIALDWTYPPGAEGPVLISGGRTGESPRAFHQLPAGTSRYLVYGLNDRLNYCFTVAVVYAVDLVAASAPLCTTRR